MDDREDSYWSLAKQPLRLELCGMEAAEALEVDEVSCGRCGRSCPGDELVTLDGNGGAYCEKCGGEIDDGWWEEAKQYAIEHCRLTRPLPDSDEYTAGDYWPMCRHDYSNYDDLIRPLERFVRHDQLFYRAIRTRVEHLIGEEMRIVWGRSGFDA